MTETHEREHAFVTRDVERYRTTPKGRKGDVSTIRKREAYKRAWWTVQWHLRGSHHRDRRHMLFLSLDDLLAIHDKHHDEDVTDDDE